MTTEQDATTREAAIEKVVTWWLQQASLMLGDWRADRIPVDEGVIGEAMLRAGAALVCERDGARAAGRLLYISGVAMCRVADAADAAKRGAAGADQVLPSTARKKFN